MLGLQDWWPGWIVVRKNCLFGLVGLGVLALYIWRLGTLTVGLSFTEAQARHNSLSLHDITSYPVNVPQRLLQYGLQSLGHHGAFWTRLPSVALAMFFLILFYLLVKNWFGRIVGTLATIILATTPWVILLARNAGTDILLLAPIAVLLSYNWLMRTGSKYQSRAWLFLVAVSAVSLYVPGLIWLILVGGLVTRKPQRALLSNIQRSYLIASVLIGLILLSPLILAIIGNFSVAKVLILWPQNWYGILETFKNIGWSALALVWHTPYHVDTIIARLAVLDVTQIVLTIFGLYAMWLKARRQLFVLIGLILLAIVAAGLNRNLMLITLALPAIAVLVAAGLRYLYVEWHSIFPNNPIPRALAVSIMSLLVLLHVFFGIRYSLAAWPHTVAVHNTYVIK